MLLRSPGILFRVRPTSATSAPSLSWDSSPRCKSAIFASSSKFRHHVFPPVFPLIDRELQVVHVFLNIRVQTLTLHCWLFHSCFLRTLWLSCAAATLLVVGFNVEDAAWPPALRGLFPTASQCSSPAQELTGGDSQLAEDPKVTSPRGWIPVWSDAIPQVWIFGRADVRQQAAA